MVYGYLVAATTHLLDDLGWVKAFCPGDLLASKIAMTGVHPKVVVETVLGLERLDSTVFIAKCYCADWK